MNQCATPAVITEAAAVVVVLEEVMVAMEGKDAVMGHRAHPAITTNLADTTDMEADIAKVRNMASVMMEEAARLTTGLDTKAPPPTSIIRISSRIPERRPQLNQ